jgi:hypothetical protein
MMPDLPKSRVSSSAPFTYVGLDYLGPLYIKENGETTKVWVCLFTCLAVRAIHLELVREMSTEQFLLCLRRFIGRHGQPKQLISDNASQLKLADTTLKELYANEPDTDDSLHSYMSANNIEWRFITEFAPWMGGYYERLVGLVKRSLRKSLGKLTVSFDQLNTLLIEVEAILNTRPLVYVTSELDSGHTLCPSDFLTLNPKTGIIDINQEVDDDDYIARKLSSAEELLKTWKRGQNHLNNFWKIWREEYLLSLRERHHSQHVKPKNQSSQDAKVGDIVQIKEDLLTRGSWKLGKVTDLISAHTRKYEQHKYRQQMDTF